MPKRVNYPWLKKEKGRAFKTMLGILADEKGFDKVISGKTSLNKFLRKCTAEVVGMFPGMYNSVKKYYKEHGREINRKEFNTIVFGRTMMLFRHNKEEKKIEKCPEHPINSDKLKKYIPICHILLKDKITWREFCDRQSKENTPSK